MLYGQTLCQYFFDIHPEQDMSTEELPDLFKSAGEVLRYLQEEKGRQIQKTKLYEDVKSGLLRKDNKKYRRVDVDRYAASLPQGTTPDGRNAEAEAMLRRRDEAEVRIQEARARTAERKDAIMAGQYVPRESVDQELAAKAATLNQGLKSRMEAVALDLVNAVGGKPKRARNMVQELEKIIDAACAEYARPMEFEVTLYDFEEDDEEGDADSGEFG
jgi:hypothetical protein